MAEILSQKINADKFEEHPLVDIVISVGSKKFIVEAKYNSPQTRPRIERAVTQLKTYAESFRTQGGIEPGLIIAVPGPISDGYRELLDSENVDLWDGPRLVEAANEIGYHTPYISIVSGEANRDQPNPVPTLMARLATIPSGRSHWPLFQGLCAEILEHLFCPPLERTIS
nr:hypothetical protein [Micromonospora sp. DSM 115978]